MNIIVGAILLLCAGIVNAEVITGKVVKVHDGDTIHVLQAANVREKIRLGGIDAPEIGQAFGRASRQYLASMIAGKQVDVYWNKRDRYGRIVGNVYIDGVDAGLELVSAGLAWHYKKYQNEQSDSDRQLYSDADRKAKEQGIGLFLESNYLPPWEWRAQKRAQ